MPDLPARPSAEHLRKLAKRLARERSARLAEAQRIVALEYSFHTWGDLLRHVAAMRGEATIIPPLFAAVRACDATTVRAALANGANPRASFDGETALHAAARTGPLDVVEALIEGVALEWQTDAQGRTALDVALAGDAADRDAIVALLDRTVISDPSFRAAVASVHAGDVAELARLLDAEPGLLHVRNLGPEAYRRRPRPDYFRDPKLFWYVANNPVLIDPMPRNTVDIARTMLAHGVEQADLDYTLELLLSGNAAREAGVQLPLLRLLLDAGARASRDAVVVAAAHRELEGLRTLVAAGYPLDAPLAASFGDGAALRLLLPDASSENVQTAFGLAVLNGRLEEARLALEAGADVSGFLPVHSHSTALHEAAGTGNVLLTQMLLAAGARTDIRDTLWDGTPLGWARYGGHSETAALFESG